MKEAIGGVSLFQIVIVLLLVFTGIMCLTINHSKAFGVKDEIINILETDVLASANNGNNYELSDKTVNSIIEHLNEVGYRITGSCPNDNWVGYDRNGLKVSSNASFCIKATSVSDAYHNDSIKKCSNGKCNSTQNDYPKMVYYDVILFYQLDVPVIKNVMNFKLNGSTKVLFG